MRKSFLVLVAVAGFMVPAVSSATPVPESQQTCRTDDNAGPLTLAAIVAPGSAQVEVCNDDTDFPLEGIIVARAEADDLCGNASIDGDPENPYLDFDQDGAGNLDGYAALEIDGTSHTPVGIEESEEGDYSSDC